MRRILLWGTVLLPVLAFADELDALVQELDALNNERWIPASIQKLESRTNEALKAHTSDARVLWRAARLKAWQCEGGTDSSKKAALGKEAADLGERAVKANPSLVEAHYFTATGLGCYSQSVGVLRALTEGLEGRFNERIDTAIKLDPSYQFAGPLTVKGRYFFELPWPKRDLGRSAEFLQKAIKTEPASLRARYYLAETQLKDGDPKKAKETLTRVFEGDESYDVAEARRIKAWAVQLSKAIEEELK
jgi:hypothetical protein